MNPLANDAPPLRSVHTCNFSAILQELDVSVLVTTYQAGKLVMLRSDGNRLNTHFRDFSKPMGLAVDGDRLAIGTSVEIWELSQIEQDPQLWFANTRFSCLCTRSNNHSFVPR